MPDAALGMTSAGPERCAPIWPAVLLCALFGVAGALWVDDSHSYGWDESMHAALPAARMVLDVRAGAPGAAVDVALGCRQYPFVLPGALACVELVLGVSEGVARAFVRAIWAFGLLGLFLAGRAAVRRAGWPADARRARLAPYLTLALALLSPLAMAYSGTLFAEIPFTALAAWAAWAWLRRDGSARREVCAGALIVLAFFTRFSNGLLLGFALFLDLAVDGAAAWRAGQVRRFAVRAAWLAALPALAFAWWFALPLPGGLATGAEHRAAFLAHLGQNRGASFHVPWSARLVDWTIGFAASPRACLLMLAGVAGTLAAVRRPAVRTLWLLLCGVGAPVAAHDFHLERFLLPQGVAIWCLAGLGLARYAPGRRPELTAAALIALAAAFPALDARGVGRALLRPAPDTRDYVERALDAKGELAPWRALPTGGLRRIEADAILDLVAAAVGPDARVAWLGINSELSPAAVHLGLLARGGSRGEYGVRFRRDAARARDDGHPDMCLSFTGVDPRWEPARLLAWAGTFDVVITTRPVDFKGRTARDWVRDYQELLFAGAGWSVERLGLVDVARPNRAPVPVEVIACRKG
jgi:hypothetical protein